MDMFSAIMRLLVGLMLTGFSIWAIAADIIQKKRCSREVTGTVVRIEEQQIRSRTEYRPVFEYEYGEQVYTTAGYFDRHNYYNVGQTKKLRIDPNDPSDVYEAEKSIWYAYLILIAGAGMLLFGIYTVKKSKADKQPDIY